MRTVRKRMVIFLLVAALCLPIMSVRADATDMTNVMVDGGMYHSIALASDGTVYTWGSNQQMQLGFDDDTSVEQKTPKKVTGLSNMVAVAAGYYFSAALSYNGTVYTWGGGNQSSPTVVSGLQSIVAIDAGQSGILALDRNGNVWQWNLGDTPTQVQGLNNIAVISAGGSHYLALTFYGDVYAWGGNWFGQLGIGSTTDSTTPQKVDLHNITDIAAGQNHSLAVAFDGTVYAWGQNSYGELGDGTTTDSDIPVPVKTIKNAVQVSAGNETSMTRTKDDKLYTWGYGEYGQLGSSNASNSQDTPQTISNLSNPPVFIACGVYHNFYISENGSLYVWGRNNQYQLGLQQNSNVDTPKVVTGVKTITEEFYETNALNSASSWALAELETFYDKDLISPIIWQNFQGNITRAEFAHMLVTVYERVKNTTASTKATKFKDIEGHLFETDIIKAYNLGFTNGTSTTTFSPNNSLTRQEAVKMLCTFLTKMRSITIPQRVTSMTYYSDVASIQDWAAPYVAYAYNENIMKGSGTQFLPNSQLSREQALLIVGRVIEKYQWG